MVLSHARRDARMAAGRPVLLADQDRRRWHADEVAEGLRLTARAQAHGRAGPYVLQASIAAQHALARLGRADAACRAGTAAVALAANAVVRRHLADRLADLDS